MFPPQPKNQNIPKPMKLWYAPPNYDSLLPARDNYLNFVSFLCFL